MPPRLEEVAAKVAFPLVAIPADDWKGTVFVGDVRAVGPQIRAVQIHYLTPSEDAGLVLSHLIPEEPSPDDPGRMTEHLASFVSHFDPGYLTSKAKRGRFIPFPPKQWRRDEIIGAFGGQTVALQRSVNSKLPLKALRTALVRDGRAGDLCVGGWKMDPLEHLERVKPLTLEIARGIDRGLIDSG
jgi:hypothetical protein